LNDAMFAMCAQSSRSDIVSERIIVVASASLSLQLAFAAVEHLSVAVQPRGAAASDQQLPTPNIPMLSAPSSRAHTLVCRSHTLWLPQVKPHAHSNGSENDCLRGRHRREPSVPAAWHVVRTGAYRYSASSGFVASGEAEEATAANDLADDAASDTASC